MSEKKAYFQDLFNKLFEPGQTLKEYRAALLQLTQIEEDELGLFLSILRTYKASLAPKSVVFYFEKGKKTIYAKVGIKYCLDTGLNFIFAKFFEDGKPETIISFEDSLFFPCNFYNLRLAAKYILNLV